MADYRLPFTGEQVEDILTNSTPQSDLTTETNRAELAEQTLQGNINTEAETRGQADTTLQGNIDAEETRAKAAEKANADDIDAIEEKIPMDASSANKLVTTNTMNSSIATATATWRGTYNLVSDLHLTISATESDIVNALSATIATVDNNDYCYVLIPVANDDPTKIARIDRYKFNGTTWGLEYTLNNSGFTAAQWEAINSGITSGLVAKLGLLPTKAELDILLDAKAPQATTYTKADVDALIANFITASVNNLVNYYLKSETYTKAEVQQLIDAVKQFTYQSVSTLPTASADTMNKIYLVPSTNPETRNVKDEFITIAVTDQGTTTYSWEQIGSTTIDLSGYYTSLQTDAAIANALAAYSTTEQMNTAITTAINTALADYSTTSQMTAAIATAIANYYTKAEVDALIANFITKSVNDLVNYYLKSEVFTKTEVNALIAAIQQFQYVSVTTLPTASADTMNKIYLIPSTNPGTQNVKDEYITIAVTDQGTTTYSWEVIGSTDIDLANYYTKQQTDGAITNALNTALADYTTTANLTTLLQGKQDTLTFDDAPTENSNNPVKSGGIYSALTGKEPVIINMAKKGFGKGTCSTAAATQAKTVTISNFLLLTNCIVTVYFQNAVGVTAATLNVSDTGAKPIMINGVTPQPGVIPPKSTVMLQYDGTNWNVISIQQLDLSFSPDYLFVDMGLPSGLMWAKRNIDVTQPNGFAASEFQYECSFFSWGNVECHNPISDSVFDYDFGSSNEGPYASTPGAALTGDASLSYDAARINCGAPWRLPTTSEYEELFNNIDYIDANGDVIDPSQTNKLVTVNGIVGLFLKSKVNGNRLFFPCSGCGNGTSWGNRGSVGYYWSSSLDSATNGRYLDFYSGGVSPQYYNDRFYGFTGRAVQQFLPPPSFRRLSSLTRSKRVETEAKE